MQAAVCKNGSFIQAAVCKSGTVLCRLQYYVKVRLPHAGVGGS